MDVDARVAAAFFVSVRNLMGLCTDVVGVVVVIIFYHITHPCKVLILKLEMKTSMLGSKLKSE